MHLNELSRDLEQFVQQEIAQGKYQSAAEVVSAAGTITEAITQALASGHHAFARQLAMDGAQQFPDHDELQKYGRILAPPTAGTPTPTTPEARAALKANNAWLKAHWQTYRGNWIALQAGHLLHVSSSFDDVIAHVGAVHGRDILLTKIH